QFLDTFDSLVAQVGRLRAKDPKGYTATTSTKRLAAIVKLAFEIIPEDPTRPEYRQGATLGDEYKHWFRAKFFQQYRLFFRYHRESRIIIYAWINDEDDWNLLVRSPDSRDHRPASSAHARSRNITR